MTRIYSIDSLKGGAVTGLIFLHCAVYYYGSIDSVDMNHPPVLIAIIGVMALWGGLFALMSGLVNTFRFDARLDAAPRRFSPRQRLFLVGLALLLVHIVYNALASPTSFDFETGNHQYSIIPSLFRYGHVVVSARRMVEGTALLMLSLNLMLLSLFLPMLARTRNPVRTATLLAAVFLVSGLLRFVLFPIYHRLVDEGHYILAFLMSPFAPNPYPVFPYFAFACAGAAFGFSLSRQKRTPRYALPVGGGLVAVGLVGALLLPTDLHGVSAFWFAKVLLELGVFTVLTWLVLRVGGFGSERPTILKRIARMSLTVFLLQTIVAEALAALLTALFPGWNLTIGAAIVFALCNIGLWFGIVALWSRAHYRFTVEHLWVTIFSGSTKLESVGPVRGGRRPQREA